LSFIGTCTEAKTWSPSWVRHSFRHSASNCQAFEAQVNLFRSHQNLADFFGWMFIQLNHGIIGLTYPNLKNYK
jgi:hypothetical protein